MRMEIASPTTLAAASVQDDCKVTEPDGDSNICGVRYQDEIRLGTQTPKAGGFFA